MEGQQLDERHCSGWLIQNWESSLMYYTSKGTVKLSTLYSHKVMTDEGIAAHHDWKSGTSAIWQQKESAVESQKTPISEGTIAWLNWSKSAELWLGCVGPGTDMSARTVIKLADIKVADCVGVLMSALSLYAPKPVILCLSHALQQNDPSSWTITSGYHERPRTHSHIWFRWEWAPLGRCSVLLSSNCWSALSLALSNRCG